MSNIKVGDKVRFLNSTGGGVVRSFKGKDQVLVEDEDGFEVPALIRECVVVGDSEMQVHSSRRSPLPPITQSPAPQPKSNGYRRGRTAEYLLGLPPDRACQSDAGKRLRNLFHQRQQLLSVLQLYESPKQQLDQPL